MEYLVIGALGAYAYLTKKGVVPGFEQNILGITVRCNEDGVGIDYDRK